MFNGKLWVMGGYSNDGLMADVWSATDLFTWEKITATAPWPARIGAGCTVFDGKLWIMGGDNGTVAPTSDVWSTSDGITWTQVAASAPWPAGTVQATTFNNHLVVLTRGIAWENHAQVWQSADGVTWECLTNTPTSCGM